MAGGAVVPAKFSVEREETFIHNYESKMKDMGFYAPCETGSK